MYYVQQHRFLGNWFNVRKSTAVKMRPRTEHILNSHTSKQDKPLEVCGDSATRYVESETCIISLQHNTENQKSALSHCKAIRRIIKVHYLIANTVRRIIGVQYGESEKFIIPFATQYGESETCIIPLQHSTENQKRALSHCNTVRGIITVHYLIATLYGESEEFIISLQHSTENQKRALSHCNKVRRIRNVPYLIATQYGES
jgi:hypothetical protein